jgi:hypothetical protein
MTNPLSNSEPIALLIPFSISQMPRLVRCIHFPELDIRPSNGHIGVRRRDRRR